MELHTWQSLTADGSVRLLAYSFGPGRANTLAVRLQDRRWMLVSPCAGAPEAALGALEGDVVALVANNGFHHLGQAAWRARHPKAVSYAPEGGPSAARRQVGRHPLPTAVGARAPRPRRRPRA